MSDIRFNQWLHQSGTGGVTQISSGHVGIGTTSPLIPVHSGNTSVLNVGVVTANNIYAGTLNGTLALSNISGITGSFTSDVTVNGNLDIADKIRHIGDTNTAIRFPSNDTFTVETSGSEALRIDSSGRLLLGTTTEGVGGGDRFTIATSGDTGMTIRSGASSAGGLYFSDGTSGADEYRGVINYNHTNNYMGLYTDSVEKLRIDSAGDLGLGVTPDNFGSFRTLHIKGPSNEGAAIRLQYHTDVVDSNDFIIYKHDAAAYLRVQGTDPLIAYLNGAERVRIDSNGFMGLGTNNPSSFNTYARDIVIARSSGDAGLTISAQDASSEYGSLHFSGGTTVRAYIDMQNGTTGRMFFMNKSNGYTAFGTNNTERLRIVSNGHVAIGDDIANDTGMFKVIAADGQSDDQYVGQFKNLEGTAGRNWGLLVTAGSNSTDESLRVRNSAQNRDHLLIRGDGVKITTSRGLNYAKTYEFNYNDGAPGGVQTKNLATISTYGDLTSAVAEVTYVGVYGTANNYISSSKWICAIRRGSNNSVWSATAAETAAGGNSGTSSLDIQWSSGVLQAVTVGPWMGWTVNVRVTILNGDITVNV